MRDVHLFSSENCQFYSHKNSHKFHKRVNQIKVLPDSSTGSEKKLKYHRGRAV